MKTPLQDIIDELGSVSARVERRLQRAPTLKESDALEAAAPYIGKALVELRKGL